MSLEIETTVDALIASYGVSMLTSYVGVKKDALGGKTEMDQWVIGFSNNKTSESFDFFTGMGNRAPATPKQKQEASYSFQGLTEKDRQGITMYGKQYLAKVESLRKPVAPAAAAVLNCLLLDAEASSTSFRNWCDEFGYDDDSISARNTYDACQENADKLRKIFHGGQIEQLREALADY